MNRMVRFFMAVGLVLILTLSAGSVWASQRLKGSVPEKPEVGVYVPPAPAALVNAPGIPVTGIQSAPGAVNMGTAVYAPLDPNVSITVTAVSRPAEIALPPVGMAFVGDSFLVAASSPTALVQVCYAYPPGMESKQADIYRLNAAVTPPVWEAVPGSLVSGGMICAASTEGYVSLIGNQ